MTATIVNGALAVHHTATVDTPWDGPAAVAAMPNNAAVLKYCHAYQGSNGKPDAKSSYSFPHHKTEGGPANLDGCRNGLARLANSSVPAADKPGVERHLRAHLTDGGGDEETENHVHSHTMNGPTMARPTMRQWFSIRNADSGDEPAQVYIYDMIGPGYFSDGVLASDFVMALAEIKNSAIDLHINSPGGDAFDAVAIYNALRRHPASVTTYIDGLAASAASFIAQAGDKVVVERNAQFMVHDASGFCIGNAADMAKMMDLLNKVSDNIADIYSQRSGVDQSTWREVMRAEAWYSSSEAVIAGLADEIGQDAPDDERLTTTARFAPTLKALGARYTARTEAPDPALLPASRTHHSVEPWAPVAHPVTPLRSSILTAAHVIVEPVPTQVPAPATVIPTPVVAQPAPTVTPEPSVPEYDPTSFRIAVLAGLAAKKR